MARKSQTRIQLSLLLLALILSVSLAYAASFSSTAANPPYSLGAVQAGTANQLFNFTLNNTDSAQNITQVQITLPSGFGYVNNSNGTGASGTGFALGGNWTPSGESQTLWQYRRAITVNGSTSGQADYQKSIAV